MTDTKMRLKNGRDEKWLQTKQRKEGMTSRKSETIKRQADKFGKDWLWEEHQLEREEDKWGAEARGRGV